MVGSVSVIMKPESILSAAPEANKVTINELTLGVIDPGWIVVPDTTFPDSNPESNGPSTREPLNTATHKEQSPPVEVTEKVWFAPTIGRLTMYSRPALLPSEELSVSGVK